MRYVRILALHFQDVFQNRGRSFIYFLMGFLNPLLLLLFWSGAGGSYWTFDEMSSYYLLLTAAMSFLIVHIEEDVAFFDIKGGVLAKYLLRPFSYFISKFMEELPWRILQGSLGLLVFARFLFFFRISFSLVSNPSEIILAAAIVLSALGVSYTLKMLLGLTAFWTTDFWGMLSIEEVVFLIFGGLVMPLSFYPDMIEKIAYALPFSYIVYFPVIAVQGKLSIPEMFRVIMTQLIWIGLLYGLYRYLWRRGVKKFTAVGQ